MIKFAKLSIITAVAGDRCTLLCDFDGPAVCTDGSWTKNGNICHKYLFRGNPENNDYCYHTIVTRESCPSNGTPVRVDDVARLIAHKKKLLGGGQNIGSTSTQQPVTTVKGSETRPSTFSFTTKTGGSSFWEKIERELVHRNEFSIDRELEMAKEIPKKVSSGGNWSDMKGPQFLMFANRNSEEPTSGFFVGLRAALLIANAIPGDADMLRDMASFCASAMKPHVESAIRSILAWDIPIRGSDESAIAQYSFMRNFGIFCPELTASPEVRALILHHKIIKHFLRDLRYQPDIYVEREKLFPQSVSEILNILKAHRFSLGIGSVYYAGENAFGDGVRKDWFGSFARKLMESGIFTMSPDGNRNTYMTDPPNEDNNLYEATGRFLALAVIHRRPLGITFPKWFFARLIHQEISVEDLKEQEPHIYQFLDLVMKAETDEELEMYSMDIDGEEVVPTLATRESVVKRRIKALISANLEMKFNMIREGFLGVIPHIFITGLLDANDLHNLLVGSLAIDVEDMIAHMEIRGGTVDSPQIVWLHRLLRSLTASELRQFVHLVTSSPNVPFEGFSGLNPRMNIDLHNDTAKLPKSSTCFNQLHLPKYRTEAELREKLLHAIANAEVPMHYAPL
jgi:hypothetical protein